VVAYDWLFSLKAAGTVIPNDRSQFAVRMERIQGGLMSNYRYIGLASSGARHRADLY
jgi:hypothetical protein